LFVRRPSRFRRQLDARSRPRTDSDQGSRESRSNLAALIPLMISALKQMVGLICRKAVLEAENRADFGRFH